MSLLDTFEATPLDDITRAHERLTASFHAGKTRSLEYRKVQLRKLFHSISDNEQRLVAALKADLGKSLGEALLTEVELPLKEILLCLSKLDKWAADEKPEVDWQTKLMKPRIRKEPLGAVLVIGAFNFPVVVLVLPVIGAIAAGNTVLIKPGEASSRTAALMVRIFSALDPDCYAVVNGAVPETTRLLELKWDKICYTGSGQVGKIVARAAVENFTPFILELGGCNPVFVTANADTKLAARRVAWGKFMNSGQVCLSPNYVLIHPSKEAEFVQAFLTTVKQFYPNGADTEGGMGHIVNNRHFKRVEQMLGSTKGTILCGGRTDEAKLFIEPTLVKVDSADDPLVSEEVFGPILSMLVVENTDKMIELVRYIGDTPLAVYAFTNDKAEQEKILSHTRSGGASINDTILHGGMAMPFGGVGTSGSGAYHAVDSFNAFVHRRAVITQSSWIESLISIRYPPYRKEWAKSYKKKVGWPAADFDRNGRVYYSGMVWTLLFLGARSPKGALLRYVLTAAVGALLAKNASKLPL